MNELTLIVTYRNRKKHLKIFLSQWESEFSEFCNLIFIEDNLYPSAENFLNGKNIVYKYIRNSTDVFNKAKLINIGLKSITTKYFCVFDIDLISYNDSLLKHLAFAKTLAPNIVAGYRLNVPYKDYLSNNHNSKSISNENKPSAIKKYLLSSERFGINPIYETNLSKSINLFDENFNGWGCEDQDFLERYLTYNNSSLFQSYDLLYLHVKHKHESNWKNRDLIESNRKYYYSKKK
jgi:predicted glycosyltransferase involved in capsule biosynthesis